MGLDITGVGGIVQSVTALVSKWIPDKTQEEQNQFIKEMTQINADIAANQAQLDINKVEAANPSVFVSGARPVLMWVGVIGMAYQWLIVPLFSFGYTTYTSHPLPVPPPVLPGDLMVMLGSLMGIHTVTRTVEKLQGVAAK